MAFVDILTDMEMMGIDPDLTCFMAYCNIPKTNLKTFVFMFYEFQLESTTAFRLSSTFVSNATDFKRNLQEKVFLL